MSQRITADDVVSALKKRMEAAIEQTTREIAAEAAARAEQEARKAALYAAQEVMATLAFELRPVEHSDSVELLIRMEVKR